MTAHLHAFEFLDAPRELPSQGFCVLFGDQRFLITSVINRMIAAGSPQERPFQRLNPDTATWADLSDELGTQSLFADAGVKLVILDNAEKFVRDHRPKLELLAAKPKRGGLLVLVVDTWLASTKLAKLVSSSGLVIDCSAPHLTRGKKKYPDEAKIGRWILSRAKSTYHLKLNSEGAACLRDLCGTELGRIDQELAKLAASVSPEETIGAVTVQKIVGGWKEETMWTAVDAALDGDPIKSLRMLDHLFRNDETPLALFAQIGWSLRRYSSAFQMQEAARLVGKKMAAIEALQSAGFNNWFGDLDKCEMRFNRLGRGRLERLATWLISAEQQLKGSHSNERRGRLIIEKLVLKFADTKKFRAIPSTQKNP